MQVLEENNAIDSFLAKFKDKDKGFGAGKGLDSSQAD